MNNYWTVKVQFEKLDAKSGKSKKANESYLVDAITFGEAEERIYKEMEEVISGEFKIKSISKSRINSFENFETGEQMYEVKYSFTDVDPESCREKIVSNYMLLQADNVKEAYDRAAETLKDMVIPYTMPAVSESPILGVYSYAIAEEEVSTILENGNDE